MNMQTVDMLLLYGSVILNIIPPTQKFWIANTGENIIDNNLDFLVFNVM